MTAATPAAPTDPTLDRDARRRRLERRATEQALVGAVMTVGTIGVWFWGILVLVQIALGVVLPRVVDVGSSVSVSLGPVGAPQVFLFVMGIVIAATMLTVHVVAGGTRRSAFRGWVVAAPVVGASFAVVGLLSTALARLVGSLVGSEDPAARVGPLEGGVPSTAALAILGTTAFLVGLAVNAAYRHLGGGRGTLFLPVVLAPAVIAHVVVLRGSTPEIPGAVASPATWAVALLCPVVAAVLLHLLLRRVPLA